MSLSVKGRTSRRPARLATRVAVIAVLAASLAACGSSGSSKNASTSTTQSSSGTTSGGGGGASAPGVTANSVTVGQIADISAPVPGLFKSAQVGVQAYFDYINSQGGVNGRKLILDSHDSAFQPANIVSAAQSIAQNDLAFVGNYTLIDSSVQPAVDANNVPNIGVPIGLALGNDQNTYSPTPSTGNDFPLGPYEWFKQHDFQATQHMGILYAAATPSAVQGYKALTAALDHLGYKVTYVRGFSAFETTFSADVVKMKAAGVQMFWMDGPDNYAATVAKEFALQNFKPINLEQAGYGSHLLPLAGSAAEGMYLPSQTALFLGEDAATIPIVKTFDTWMKKVDSTDSIALWGATAWASAALFVQALKDAGKNPTRASLRAALNKITSFNADGLIATSNPAQNIPASCWLLAQVKNGAIVRVPPSPKTGFACSPGDMLALNGFKPMVRNS